MIFYFSGCGNSRFIAKEITAALNESLNFIPDLQQEGYSECLINEGESLGFVFPIYAWALPKLVEDFIKSVKWKGNPSYVWFACTCGDEMGMARKAFEKLMLSVGLHLDASFCFKMPETYLDFPFFKLDSKESEGKKIADARRKLPAVIDQIRNKEKSSDVILGSFPKFKTYIIGYGFSKIVGDKKYFSTNSCISCGKCVKVCPLKNITLENDRPKWNGNCTQCMACYQYCPTNAIQYGNCTKGKGQYHFEE